MTGKIWIFGDDIDTDALAPGAYMKGSLADLAAHCLEDVDPAFASGVARGDVIVAGRNFGVGSSREQAAEALKHLGLAAVIAESFAGIFYRNALNLGLPVLTFAPDESARPKAGEALGVNPATGTLTRADGTTLCCEPIPPDLWVMVQAGGLVPHLEQRFRKASA